NNQTTTQKKNPNFSLLYLTSLSLSPVAAADLPATSGDLAHLSFLFSFFLSGGLDIWSASPLSLPRCATCASPLSLPRCAANPSNGCLTAMRSYFLGRHQHLSPLMLKLHFGPTIR
ncbi:hypothetical protein F8388_019111, partial [Cannabis sativa]